MHDGLYLTAPDLLGAATLGERGDGSNRLRIGLLLEDRLEVPVQAAELGSKLLLRRGTPRGDPLRRLFLEMAQEEPQQVPGLPRRDGWRFSRVRRLRGFRPARLQVPEGAGQIVTHCGTGRQVVHVAFDHCFLHTRSGTQHDARDEPPHPMHGHPRRAPLGRALPHGNRQLDALWITRAGGRDQTERQARRARADRPEQLGEERAAEHGDLGIGVALERVERERDPQRCAVTEERALALGQAQLGVIGGASGGVAPPIGSIDSRASSSSVTWTPSRWRFASQPGALTTWLVPSPSRRRPGTDSVSNRRSRRMALSSGAMSEFNCSCSLPSALLFSMSAPIASTRRAKSASPSAASHSSASRPSNCCAPPNSPRIRSSSPTTSSNSLIFWSSSWRMYDSIVPAAARFTMWTSRFCPMRCSRPIRCSTTIGFQGRS